jgi:1-deoxy-D-xylulose-5-phosphate synthase
MAKANQLRGVDASVVAVIGDGAMTGGMAWEALNNIAAGDRPVVIVVNDNGRSYTPTVGGLANRLTDIRTNPRYESTLHAIKERLNRRPGLGPVTYDALHAMKKGIKDALAPQGMFEDLGLKYIGPVDGHDVEALEHALRRARDFGGPVLVHAITQKGRGYAPALSDEADRFHAVPPGTDPRTGVAHRSSASRPGWGQVFGDEMVAVGADRADVVAVTAAMLIPVGLQPFSRAYPDRVFDVGIAEQHAATSAAGMAFAGMHPVVAVYASFLNRAFDQVLMDCALHGAGVTFVLDRAGVTGSDGASHNGVWDMSVLQCVPGLRLAAPRDAAQLRAPRREALTVDDAPTVVRYPKGAVPEDLPARRRVGGVDVLHEPDAPLDTASDLGPADVAPDADVLVVAVGSMAAIGLEAADRLAAHGMRSTVVDPRWVIPIDPELVAMAARHRVVVAVEDGLRVGGVGARLAQELRDAGIGVPVVDLGVPARFLDHGDRGAILAELGLTAQDVARQVTEWISRLDPVFADPPRVKAHRR